MYRMAAREAKNEFGRLLDNAQREPVTIEKKGRPVAVLLSLYEYQRIKAIENHYLDSLAQKVQAEASID